METGDLTNAQFPMFNSYPIGTRIEDWELSIGQILLFPLRTLHQHIVDQASGSQPHGRGNADRAGYRSDRLHVFGIDDLEVLDADRSLLQNLRCRSANLYRVLLPRSYPALRFLQRAKHDRRDSPLFRIQVLIP